MAPAGFSVVILYLLKENFLQLKQAKGPLFGHYIPRVQQRGKGQSMDGLGKTRLAERKKKPNHKKTHRGKILQETVKNFQANINPAFSSSHLATKSRERVLRANVVNGAQILYHTAHARS